MATYFGGRAILCGGLAAVLAVAAPAAPAAAPQAAGSSAKATPVEGTPGLKMVRNLDYGGSANVRQMLDLYLHLLNLLVNQSSHIYYQQQLPLF